MQPQDKTEVQKRVEAELEKMIPGYTVSSAFDQRTSSWSFWQKVAVGSLAAATIGLIARRRKK